jgi:UDP-N-acetylmuramate: L-alanyl-gamma-D-glutamyl-meso-diaminopimelate ligase
LLCEAKVKQRTDSEDFQTPNIFTYFNRNFFSMQQKKQKIHFIAIGGSVMHNLAIALKQGGMK